MKINMWSEPWLRDDKNCYVETTASLQFLVLRHRITIFLIICLIHVMYR
ncbi:hypothetical protein LINGRAHAP2_LOCUS10931 [Linum grandiflorum]